MAESMPTRAGSRGAARGHSGGGDADSGASGGRRRRRRRELVAGLARALGRGGQRADVPVAVRIDTLWRRDFTEERLRELHALACVLMAEDFDHFCVHADTNDIVFRFRRADTDELVGFQFWRTMPMTLPRTRAIVGGKLRVLPEFRGRGLHLVSALRFYLHNQLRNPHVRYYRLSIASLFGFVSITGALRDYQLLDPRDPSVEGRAITAAFQAMASESHYDVDPETGLVFVNIDITPETLAAFGPDYFERPAARAYAAHNPDYRSNGSYVGFWFRLTPGNLWALTRAIARKRWRGR